MENTYTQNKGVFITQHFQTSFFYDLQELIRNAPLLRKYYYIFKALNLSALPDRNDQVGKTGYSQHAILRAFIIKHLERVKSVPQLIEYLYSIPPLAEMCAFDLGKLPDDSQFYRFLKNIKNSTLKDVHKTANDKLKSANQKQQRFQAVKLDSSQKHIVRKAILEEAQKINQKIFAIAVCSNHVHIAAEVSSESIEQIVHRYKRLSTFVLRKAGLDGKVWSTGFDKRFCFTDKDIGQKVKYVNGHK